MQTFNELELPEILAQSLAKIGFVEPTPIQQKAIPFLEEGQDLMACAETGSGKTAAYTIPMLKTLLADDDAQGMILVPTRELAQQVAEFVDSIAPNQRVFHTVRLVGGQDIRKQFKKLQKKPRLIIATPGRLIDHLQRNTIQIHNVATLVLDEGDRMIDMGFAPQLEKILKYLPKKRQTALFSATLDDKVKKIAKKYLHNPKTMMLSQSRPVASIKQTVIPVEFKHKDECILSEIHSRQGSIIIFLKTKHRTDKLTKLIGEFGFSVDHLHGGRTQGQRNKAIKNFKAGKTRILCATDVAARGIDVPSVEHVINFDIPMQDEDYVHRIGRTARNGAEGEAVSLVTPDEHQDWNRIVKKYDIPDAMLEVSRSKQKRTRKTSGRSSGKRSEGSGGKRTGKRFSKSSDSTEGKKTGGKKSSKRYSKSNDSAEGKKTGGKKSGKRFSKSSDSAEGKKAGGKKSSKRYSKSSDSTEGKKKTSKRGKTSTRGNKKFKSRTGAKKYSRRSKG